ncbi:hypothetical protein TNCV_5028551 [Trichonephila clavipes]|nr:hypothetical protein TNCV_5028551 [Trichonephila clavipes]
MPLSRMLNSTFAMPNIIDSHDMGLRTVLQSRRPKLKSAAEWSRYQIVACLVTSSSPVPLKTRRVGERFTQTYRELKRPPVGVVLTRGGSELRCRPRHLTMVQKPSCS